MAEKIGILVGGGPAPGINSVISSVTIEAINSGLEVIGIYDGFKHLVEGKTNMVKKLSIEDVSRIHIEGGSILRTSRVNPAKSEKTLEKTVQTLKKLGIKYLVTIGGDDTAFSASRVCEKSKGEIKVAHVPKTIDNDLPLPDNMPTFGFETARHVATELVYNLMQDSRTTDRWYFVAMMGREAGHLALGVGKAASATITIIPEEFKEGVTLEEVCDVLDGAILKRKLMGRNDGVAIIGEGIAEKIDPEELANIPGVIVEKDPHGHLRLAEIPLATILKRAIEKRFAERGEKVRIVDVTIGYELRSARPIPFDIVYTRTLGYGAVRFLLGDYSDLPGGMVCVAGGRIKILPFDAFMDPKTKRTKVRLVDVHSEDYKVARKYMIRLEKKDLEDEETLKKLAKIAKMDPDEFKKKYWHTTELP
ncbi:diphosphate--fructose-6-phosphate 1-phosphotransferase [Thermotoga sp. KOL6]|uniref:diphosphate--fructose-6-phosphate 1-phosphotransferase n=1 Tax=Thermotoga sp. KOL6 TaxID=126741 RepID=UPI000C77A617|nr:diphosphate--fructose-6-phosphate 1-phosphotransferase [Thermotoga sp. KOL6]PLV59032.1 6-phosphofructokinase [Thermotoga sp. KOL6]